ncbi:carbohydrate ABC transporter permease [Athalassotoga saccharophila]|uniref:carbohydrate ABC transporter permease n=1 Tax=Athalassotoga saccharophila TaxID=1441386 RepID=UPI0018D71BE8|nr:sugar ABC transporter permease [Athalassotoga saccharophila]BBJ28816.1 L-arabinose transport system permease protein AraP [Athalassotoga saccharophila]
MKRVREWIAGYLFILPIIIVVGVFVIYPIFASIYYSFTNYNPLRQMEYKNTFNLQDQLEQYLLIFSMKDLNVKDLLSQFDPADFIQTQLGIKLDKDQKAMIEKYFDSKKLMEDFVGLKTNKRMNGSQFMSEYMSKYKEMFSGYTPAWVGLKNFYQMINDSLFWKTLWNSIFFSIIVTPVQTFIALLLAVAANQKIRGIKFFKLSFYIPSITSSAAISMLFMLLYAKPGIINRFLGFIGIPPIDWLSNTSTALPAVMAMNIWTTAGYFMIVFLAGLQNIPKDLIEASELDGATGWTRFWKIIMPLVKPQISYVVTLGLIGTLQVFDQIYFLIQNQQNYTTAMYIYVNAFNYNQMGYASAIAVFFLAFIMVLTLVQRKVVKEESYF